MSIENARKHLENAANSGRAGMKWEANVELCLDAIIDTLETRDNRTTVPTPTVAPEGVVGAVRWCSDLEHNLVQGPSRILTAAVRELSAKLLTWAPDHEISNAANIARAVHAKLWQLIFRHVDALEGTTQTCLDGELCDVCGKRYLTVYRVPDNVWRTIRPRTSDPDSEVAGGLLCPLCADQRAREAGMALYWEPSVGDWLTNKAISVEDERDELAAALRVLLRDAVILSAEYLSTFDDWGPDHVIQGWEKSRWIRARAAADQARAALAKVGTTQKPKTFDSVVEMVRDLFPDDPGIVVELERRMQRMEGTDG